MRTTRFTVALSLALAPFASACGSSDTAEVPEPIVVARDRFVTHTFEEALCPDSRAEPCALRDRVWQSGTLREALDWAMPAMGDDFVADRRFAAIDLPMEGGALFNDWADKHLKWSDLDPPDVVDVPRALLNVSAARGQRLCVRGDFRVTDKTRPREAVLTTREQGASLKNQIHVVGAMPPKQDDVRFCGVIIGRRVVGMRERPGLILTGMLRDEPAPKPRPPTLEEEIERFELALPHERTYKL